jgi:hypothetical protein
MISAFKGILHDVFHVSGHLLVLLARICYSRIGVGEKKHLSFGNGELG